MSPLPYRSQPLAALLDVFAMWGSDGFIGALSHSAGHDLEPTSVVAITVLARGGPMRPSALAARLRVGASNISKISSHLATRDLIAKSADPHDSRASLLDLTATGREFMADLVRRGDAMMNEILGGWTDTDRRELGRLLADFERDAAAYAKALNPDISR
ncbi:MarR family winged helix-turn-helix transcriptional regulator [Spelaeicoccus albus]